MDIALAAADSKSLQHPRRTFEYASVMLDGLNPAAIFAIIAHELERALRSDDMNLLSHFTHSADVSEWDDAPLRSVGRSKVAQSPSV